MRPHSYLCIGVILVTYSSIYHLSQSFVDWIHWETGLPERNRCDSLGNSRAYGRGRPIGEFYLIRKIWLKASKEN